MAKIRITENILKQIVAESVKRILKNTLNETQTLPNAITYNGDGENREMWYEAGITMDDFVLVPDMEIAQYHSSRKGYIIYYEGQEFGEAWLESDGLLRGNSDNDIFNGYMRVFDGYGVNGLLEDIMDKTADAIINGNEDDDWDEDDWDEEY